jgi:hypothetical protein
MNPYQNVKRSVVKPVNAVMHQNWEEYRTAPLFNNTSILRELIAKYGARNLLSTG